MALLYTCTEEEHSLLLELRKVSLHDKDRLNGCMDRLTRLAGVSVASEMVRQVLDGTAKFEPRVCLDNHAFV